jgi:hypothetical protein
MTDAPIMLPAEMITVGVERPIRMAVDAPSSADEPMIPAAMIPAAETRASAVPSYAAPISFDWRRDQPLAEMRLPDPAAS